MILQALVKEYESLAEQGKVSQPGWCQTKVSYEINLYVDGRIKQIICLKQEKRNWEKEGFNSQNDESTADGHQIFRDSSKFSV